MAGRAALALAAATVALVAVPGALGAVFTVTTTDDLVAGDCTVTQCSLRQAINAANADAAVDEIRFSIVPAGSKTITPASPLPGLVQPVTIDGTTQPGWIGPPIVELSGTGAGAGAIGLQLSAAGSTVRGLVVNSFTSYGVFMSSSSTIERSYIGTGLSGSTDLGNGNAGIYAGSGNTIGGTSAGAGNLISGNGFTGITLEGFSNTVAGNVIGLDATGTSAIANCFGGIRVGGGLNLIGGTAAGAGNVISGNQGCGVGGWAGVSVYQSEGGNTIQGNLIGTNATGTAVIPTGDIGVRIMGTDNNLIGGTVAGAANVITAPTASAIEIDDFSGSLATGNRVEGNYIGTNAAGADLGSAGPAISLQASGNSVGDTGAGGNVIANSSADGVRVVSGSGNRIVGNSIYGNALLGIDLAGDGVTANDANDADEGPNDRQNFPVLTSATLTGSTLAVAGTLGASPATAYRLELFYSPTCDASGNGEGEEKRGFVDVLTDDFGSTSFAATSSGGSAAVGGFVTATATDSAGSTSEFSACVTVTAGAAEGAELVVNSAANTNDGCTAGDCTLREAIAAANDRPGLDTIRFAIGSGPVTISPISALPLVTDPVVLDATTQPGYDGVPLVRLDGSGAEPSTPGIEIISGGSTVRGFAITNFPWDGVKLREGDGNTIEDNDIGISREDGVLSGGNGTYGVLADFGSSNNVIRDNLIGRNGYGPAGPYAGVGIWNGSTGNVVERNSIGVVGGSAGAAYANAIGIIVGETTGTQVRDNVVAHNTGPGVTVFGEEAGGNRITENAIHTNGALGIDLGLDGVTDNDGADADGGPNGRQNFPVLTAIGAGSISGTLASKPSTAYRLEFYSSAACDRSEHGEGARLLGATDLSTNADGFADFTASFPLIAVGEYVTATATDPDGNTSEFSRCFLVPEAGGVTAEVTIAPQEGSETVSAPARVELEDVPAETFIAAARQTLEAAPLGSIPLGSIPLGSIPLGSIPLGSIPLGSIGLLEPQIRALLGDVALSTVPLAPPQSWESLLQGTSLAGLPLQTLSLEQALDALAAQPDGVASVPLGSIGLENSVLGSITPEAVGLGVAPLGSIQIGDEGADEPGDTNLDDWCEWLSGPPVNCTNPASLQPESVLSTSLQGVPLGSIPLGSIPLGSIPLGSIPLGSIPLGSIDVEFSPLGSIPLGSIPLGSIPLGSIPLGSIPLGSIDLQQSPLGSIPLGSIPLGSIPTLFTCQPACPTGGVLRDHLGQLRPDLTLESLLRAVGTAGLGTITFADVLLWVAQPTLDGYTARQLVETVLLVPGNALTLADLLAAFLAESSLGWERLDLEAAKVNTIAAEGGTARYAVEVELTPDAPAGAGAANTTVVSVTLPDGFAYVPGSSALDGPVADPGISGRTLTWTLPLTVGPRYRLTFDAKPGLLLGPAQATVTADAAGAPPVAGPAPATVTVEDTFEANGDPGGALTAVATSSFYLSYVTGAGDVDYFTFPVPSVPGTRTTFNLSHLPVDLDLVVYGPAGQVLRTERAGTEPLDGQPLDDDGPTLTSEADALEQETLSDLALANLPLLGVSTFRGTEDDALTVVSDGSPGNYVIQVTGFNGAGSAEPYMLRAEQRAPVEVPACQPRQFPNGGTDATTLTRGTVPAAVDTVFVVNKAQWERVHGAAAVGSALTGLDGLMAGLAADGHPSAILQVDADPDVRAAVESWNACPTELTRANAVMREIGLAIDAFRAASVDARSNSTVQNIVLLGGDDVIPAARLEDRTTVANEQGYAETFERTTELSTTLRLGYFLSDDPYGDVDPVPFFDRQLHIPDVPVGRLPATPAAAVQAVTRFTAFDGRLAPSTAVTTGYDFLVDGAERVDSALRAIPGIVGSNPPGLIGDTWSKTGLLDAFLPGGVPPDLSSINGHADHRGLQPATGTALFEVGDLPPLTGGAAEAFDGKLVFSMGCHAGLSVSDVSVVSPLGTSDWPQAYTQRGGIYAASSGFAYGDGELVAYSEDLHRRFAENLGGLAAPGDLTIGEAIVLAKQDYFGELGIVGVYDEKASAELTLYGLPMWQIGGAAAATATAAPTASATAAASDAVETQSPPSDQELVVEPATGLTAEQLTADWTPPAPTPAPGGSYVVGRDGVQVTHFRPVEPKTVLPVTVPSAHGALITELSSTSTTPFDPYFARPIVDSTALEPTLDWDRLVHPAKLQTVTTSKLGTAKLHRLVLATGQFTGPPGGGEIGTQRLFPRIRALVFSSPSTDYAKPVLGRIVATGVGASVAFSVETRDRAPNGADDVVRVRVGYLDQPDGGTTRAWTFVDLVRTPATDRWSGAGPLVSAGAQFQYFVQAVDRAGNVAVSTNKGVYYEEATTAPPSAGGLSIETPAAPPGGWFDGDVPVTVRVGAAPATAADGIQVDVDGRGFEPYGGPVTVTGDGPHVVTARAPDGREVAVTVLIDTGPPQILVTSPADGAQIVQGQPVTADYECLDAGAGVAPSACTGPVASGAAVDTSTVGPKTFTVTAQDRLGKQASKTVSYTVVRRSIVFTSFRTGFGDIYAVAEGGGAVTRLTATSAVDAEPAWSPDGSKIAFTSTRAGNVELYSMNADGSDVRRLTTNAAVDSSPAWSPDGTKIAFSSTRAGNQLDLYVMNADGSGVQRLTTDPRADLTPAWSPNGEKIAFSSTRTGKGDIYVMNADGSGQTRLTTANAVDAEPDWSPDGAKIAFTTNRHGTLNFELYVMNANGSSQTRLTTNAAADTSPSWSADGTKLAFSSTRDGNFEVYVIGAGGSSPVRVTDQPAIDATPDW